MIRKTAHNATAVGGEKAALKDMRVLNIANSRPAIRDLTLSVRNELPSARNKRPSERYEIDIAINPYRRVAA
jgi:hypothetical protein